MGSYKNLVIIIGKSYYKTQSIVQLSNWVLSYLYRNVVLSFCHLFFVNVNHLEIFNIHVTFNSHNFYSRQIFVHFLSTLSPNLRFRTSVKGKTIFFVMAGNYNRVILFNWYTSIFRDSVCIIVIRSFVFLLSRVLTIIADLFWILFD